jgi:hypothetical protein
VALALVLLRSMGSHSSQLKPYLDSLPTALLQPTLWDPEEVALLHGFVRRFAQFVRLEFTRSNTRRRESFVTRPRTHLVRLAHCPRSDEEDGFRCESRTVFM